MNYCQLPKLKNQPGLFHAFSNKEAGDFGSKDVVENIKQNHLGWLAQFSIDISKIKIMPAAGGDNIAVLDESNKNLPEQADAIITNQKDIYLGLTVADCLPIILFDAQKSVLALAHAGWKGTDKNIAVKTVEKMKSEFGCEAKNIIAGIGPAIHKSSYIKDKSFREEISSDLNKYVFDDVDDKVQIDLIAANEDQLKSAGITENNIEISDHDTYSNKYFSHSRSKKTGEPDGRNFAIVGMNA